MKDADLRQAWLDYASSFPHVAAFFKRSNQYKNQRSFSSDGKRIPSKINLYTYFTEQCFNLLRPGGQCGIVLPSGIYTDLGTKQLREMLFSETGITGMFGFENRKAVFEGVHRSYKFVVLTFGKGGETLFFPAAFMRHDVEELSRFPQEGAIEISIDLVSRTSPDSLSIMEFSTTMDVLIAKKVYRYPLLSDTIETVWNAKLSQEFNMTTNSNIFQSSLDIGSLPSI